MEPSGIPALTGYSCEDFRPEFSKVVYFTESKIMPNTWAEIS